MISQNKITISLIIFFFSVILLIIFVIYPLFGEIKENSKELILQKKNMTTLQLKIENLENFKSLYEKYRPSLEKIDNLFVDPEVPIEFIAFLEKTAEETQIEIKISPVSLKKSTDDLWSFIAFQITSNSSFPNFLKFLEKLETSPYLVRIQNLSIHRLTEKEIPSEIDTRAIFSIKTHTQ